MAFSNIFNMSLSVNNSNSTSVFLKHPCNANPGAVKSEQDQDHIFICTYL